MKKGTTGAAPIAPTPYFLSHPYGSPDNRNAPQVSVLLRPFFPFYTVVSNENQSMPGFLD